MFSFHKREAGGKGFQRFARGCVWISSKAGNGDNAFPSARFSCQTCAPSENFSEGSTIEFTLWSRFLLYFTQEEWKRSTGFQDTLWLLWYKLQWICPTAVGSQQVQRKLDKTTLGWGVHSWRIIFQSALGNPSQTIITIIPQQPQSNDLCGVLGMVIWEKSEQLVQCCSLTHHKHSASQTPM